MVKMEQRPSSAGSNEAGSLGPGKGKSTGTPVRTVKLRNVRLRKPNWTLRESQDLLDEFDKHKLILNARGNTGVSTKAKRKLAWTRIAHKINSKDYSAVKRTVYECKRRWKNMVTFAKMSILEYIKAIKLGGEPPKTVSAMDRKITEVHGDVKLLHTLRSAERRELDDLTDEVGIDSAREITGGNKGAGCTPTSSYENPTLHLTLVEPLSRSQQTAQTSRHFYSDGFVMETDNGQQEEATYQSFEEQTPSIENYYSLQSSNPDSYHGASGIALSQGAEHSFVDEPRYARGLSDENVDTQEVILRRRKLQMEIEKLQLEKEVLEMQKAKIRLETKAWRKFVSQRSSFQTASPFSMPPFYWPSPAPGFPAFYGSSPNIGHSGVTQLHANSAIKKHD